VFSTQSLPAYAFTCAGVNVGVGVMADVLADCASSVEAPIANAPTTIRPAMTHLNRRIDTLL